MPVYYVSKLARDNGVVVCQVGEGADELFWGYRELEASTSAPAPRRPAGAAVSKGLGVAGLARPPAGATGGAARWLLAAPRTGQPVFWSGAEAFDESQKQRLLSPRLRREVSGATRRGTPWRPIRRRFEDKAWEKSHLHWMTYLDLNLRLPELLLMRVDKMSMGVEPRGAGPLPRPPVRRARPEHPRRRSRPGTET